MAASPPLVWTEREQNDCKTVMSRGAKTVRSRIGDILRAIPGGEAYVRQLPKTTLESYISGKDSDMYVYSGTFTPNDKLVGTWAWAVWPAANKPGEIDDRINAYVKAKTKNGKQPLPKKVQGSKDTLQLIDGGKVNKSRYFGNYFWSGSRLIGNNDDQALKMEVRTIAGHDWLIVERGGFNAVPDNEEDATAAVPADYHCGYHIYLKQ